MDKFNEFIALSVTMASEKPFEQVVEAIEARVGRANHFGFKKLIDAKASYAEVESAVSSMVGSSDFMIFAYFESGQVLSLCGKPKQAKLYIIGNPLIANQMYEHNPAVGLYVPLRLFVYNDYNSKTHISYDQPSSLMSQFEDQNILKVAQMLDTKLEKLVTDVIKSD